MIFSLFALTLSISQEQCMVCASTLQAVQLEALKGKMTKEELEKFHAELCAQFGFLKICGKIKNEFDSILPELTQQSAGKVCAKHGICVRRKASEVRNAMLPTSNDNTEWCECESCKAIIKFLRTTRYYNQFTCDLLAGPIKNYCEHFNEQIQTIINLAKNTKDSDVKCCEKLGFC